MNGDFRVGSWLVASSLNTISRKGTTVHLEPKVIEVLVCLAQHAGETVSKQTLFHTVWPDTFVTDDVLTHSISELRRAFEDNAREPRIIQTIPKRGYRLVVPVSKVGAINPGIAADSIAVLPFTSMSAYPEDEFFADGITEEIVNALAQIEQLRVVARTSAFSFKGKCIDVRVVGKYLNVRTVLLGGVRRDRNKLRITAQLINVEDGYHLWSDRYDREVEDIFEVQEEIAQAIADRLKVALRGRGQDRLINAATKNLGTYQVYVRGRDLLYRRGAAVAHAVECFERDVALDSDYALAWAGLADSYTVLGYYGHACPEANMPRAVEAARRAVGLAPSLAEGHSALAMASLMGIWDRDEAEREFLRALELNPRYTQARDWYALFFLQYSEGRLEEGNAQAKLALISDPLSSYAHAIYGLTCANAGKHAEAVLASRRAIELDSESYLARVILQYVLHASGQLEESVAAAELALAISGRHPWPMAFLAVTLADSGKSGDADAVYSEMRARARRQYVPPGPLALAASSAAREVESVRHASEAFAVRDPHCQFFLSRYNPYTVRSYAYPRFREIIASMGRSEWLRD